MKIGIVLQSNSPERVWNTFRFGITSLKANHKVSVFLMSEGSELESIENSESFDISKKVSEFRDLGGVIYACGTCLTLRKKEGSAVCPISTMSDLLTIIEESDKILVF